MKHRFLAVAVLLSSSSVFAATFVVPSDRAMVHRADAIVVASNLASYTTLNHDLRDAIETVSTFSVEEVIKGDVGRSLEVREPGGTYRDRATVIGGVPQFRSGERYLLFLLKTKYGWSVIDLALGKFSFAADRAGRRMLTRDAQEIVGWDPDGSVHREVPRAEQEFLTFVRTEARGGMAKENYWLPESEAASGVPHPAFGHPLPASGERDGVRGALVPAPLATFSPTTYTMLISGSLGGRWTVFPNAVSFTSVGTEPGAPGGGSTAITAGMAAWNNDPNSNVNYAYAGADNGTHTAGLNSPDGANTVAFERDLSARGIPAFTCSANGYSGTLGIGGVTDASGTHTGPAGETFVTTLEGDVEMNKGIANCTLLFNNGDFNSAVAHELGHTLGFRHADQDRNGGACPSTIECSTQAIMKSFITQGLNAALQPWDQHAVDAVYPGSSNPPPTGGRTRYDFNGDGRADIVWHNGNGDTWLWLMNGNSPTSTQAIGNQPSPWTIAAIADFDGDGKADLVWRNTSSGDTWMWLMNGATATAHISLGNVAPNWSIAAAADFNGDTKADLVWRNNTTGDTWLWLMSGGTVTSRTPITNMAPPWTVAAGADFNADGKADLIWRNTSTGETWMWIMNGASIVTAQPLQTLAPVWSVAAAADFDGNGTADLAWRNTNTGDTWIWLMNGSAVTSAQPLATEAPPWTFAVAADFNGDNRADIIWRNTSSGDTWLWTMNGTSPVSFSVIPNPGTGYSIVKSP